MDSIMSMMHSQINRAISSAVSDRVIPEIRNFLNSMIIPHQVLGTLRPSSSLNSQGNREGTAGMRTKISKKDSRSACDLRNRKDHGPYKSLP